MIVTCTNCQAKFRVADEKIGPRGAKVRCSKCQTVFLVRREGAEPAAPAPAPSGLELEPPRPVGPARAVPPPLPPPLPQPPPLPGARSPDPFAATLATFPPPAASPADPFAAAAPEPASAAAPDPFAQASADPFAPAPPPAADPFAHAPATADPFAAAADPFASPSGPPDPFAPAPAEPPAGADVGDLLGAAASAAPSLAAAEPAPPAPAEDTDGLALEERAPAPPRPASSAPFDADAGYDAFAGGDAQGFDPGALELGSPATAVPPVTAPTDAPPVLSPAAPAPADGAPAAPRRAQGDAPADASAPALERSARGGRLRSVAVNAVALAALLVAAVVIFALWRTEGPIDAAALRPGALVSALRGGRADAPFAPRDVRSGLYERERAPPVLFVRGTVVSRAAAAVARVAVRVELVRGGAVVATGEAIAGALPTPEELWSAHDAAALAEVALAAARRAPAEVRPGDAVPFLVAIADQPADLSGTSLRVHAAPAGSPAP